MLNTIIISNSANFPWGMAASNRIRNLAKGLILNNCAVEYIGMRGAEVENHGCNKKKGLFEGIKFNYPGGSPIRSKFWLPRRIDDFFGFIFSLIYVLHQKISGKLDAVIIYSMHNLTVLFWSHFLHLINVPVVLEVCEWPLARVQKEDKRFKAAYKFCYKILPEVDAVLPISTHIQKEIRKVLESLNKNIPSLLIPILIDVNPHEIFLQQKSGEPYLMYSGAIGYFDIALFVVETLHELKTRGINLLVKFTGSISSKFEKKKFEELRRYAAGKGILNQLELTGYLEEHELHKLMHSALALLAPLPETLQSESKFPTKLGYYLVSGSPVVTNAVGEVGLYLQDGINAFVAKKFDARQIADKIEQIINNPSLAKQIGQNGQKLAMEKFHYASACKGLNNFVQQVINNYQ